MTEHVSTVIVAAVSYSVVARIVTTTLATTPSWLLVALGGLVLCSLAVVGIACLLPLLFVIGLVDAIEHERNNG